MTQKYNVKALGNMKRDCGSNSIKPSLTCHDPKSLIIDADSLVNYGYYIFNEPVI